MKTVVITRESLCEDLEGISKEALLLEAADRFKYFFSALMGISNTQTATLKYGRFWMW